MEKIELQVIVIPFKVVTQYTVWGEPEYISADPLIMFTLIYSSHFYKIEAVSLIFTAAVQLRELQYSFSFFALRPIGETSNCWLKENMSKNSEGSYKIIRLSWKTLNTGSTPTKHLELTKGTQVPLGMCFSCTESLGQNTLSWWGTELFTDASHQHLDPICTSSGIHSWEKYGVEANSG